MVKNYNKNGKPINLAEIKVKNPAVYEVVAGIKKGNQAKDLVAKRK